MTRRRTRVEDEADLIAANKLVRRPSVAQRRQARPRSRSRGFVFGTNQPGNEKRLQPEIGPQVGNALRASNDIKIREQSGDERTSDGVVVAHCLPRRRRRLRFHY